MHECKRRQPCPDAVTHRPSSPVIARTPLAPLGMQVCLLHDMLGVLIFGVAVETAVLTGVGAARLQFHPPTEVGPGSGYASNFNAISPTVFVGSSLNDYVSVDGGATWTSGGTHPWNGFGGFAGLVGSTFFRPNPNDTTTIRNLGFDLAGVESSKRPCGTPAGVNDSWYSCFTEFTTPWYSVYTTVGGDRPSYRRVNATTTFTGFPFPVSLHGDTVQQTAEHDFGRDGGGVTVLKDGTLVLTADVRWGHDRGAIADAARAEDLTLATSVVALRSTDGGKTFVYTATLCEAAHHRGCGECCNENDVVTLADGKSVMAVWRMGAGDGLIWNKTLGINGSYEAPPPFVNSDVVVNAALCCAQWSLLCKCYTCCR
jgi:hypothetical protein